MPHRSRAGGMSPRERRRESMGKTRHGDRCSLAFGRLSPEGECARCDELRGGARPRQGWGARQRQQEEATLRAIRNHDCQQARCGPVCTAFDW